MTFRLAVLLLKLLTVTVAVPGATPTICLVSGSISSTPGSLLLRLYWPTPAPELAETLRDARSPTPSSFAPERVSFLGALTILREYFAVTPL